MSRQHDESYLHRKYRPLMILFLDLSLYDYAVQTAFFIQKFMGFLSFKTFPPLGLKCLSRLFLSLKLKFKKLFHQLNFSTFLLINEILFKATLSHAVKKLVFCFTIKSNQSFWGCHFFR